MVQIGRLKGLADVGFGSLPYWKSFPIETIHAVTDPVRGIASELKWLPTIVIKALV